ncbi:MAG: MBL fold metallo-hydrolase [Gemmatimonadetes bacterium]|nr:MBL fold metallo-hydrolase [Gemmatimonadota bacterium]
MRPIRYATLVVATTLVSGGCGRESVKVTFIDVGQGDATLIETPDGRVALVDAGESDLGSQLHARGVEQIDLLVASHPHDDHIGGLEGIVERFPVRAYLDNGVPHETHVYRRLVDAIEARPSITYLAAGPRTIQLGDVTVEVLATHPARRHGNDGSVALLVRYGEFSVLLTGDAETEALDYLVESGAVPDITVLKASHHGSDNGFTEDLLAAGRPEVVVISVGAGNAYGHPGEQALAAYYAAASEVYRTDLDGSVTVRGVRNGRYRILTHR